MTNIPIKIIKNYTTLHRNQIDTTTTEFGIISDSFFKSQEPFEMKLCHFSSPSFWYILEVKPKNKKFKQIELLPKSFIKKKGNLIDVLLFI